MSQTNDKRRGNKYLIIATYILCDTIGKQYDIHFNTQITLNNENIETVLTTNNKQC